MAEIQLPVGPEQLLRYFEGVAREHPDEHWRNGVQMCQQWLRMMSAQDISQADIDAFVARLEAEPKPGSGWIDLGMQFGRWAWSRGFKVRRLG